MRLTVLGSSASYVGPGQACAGHLIESDTTKVLLDCGNGVISNLGKVADPLDLDAVIVTHAHVDHFADIYPLFAGQRYAPSGVREPMPLYVAGGVYDLMLAPLSERARAAFRAAFVVSELSHALPVRIGTLTLVPMRVDHIDPTFALRIDDGAGVVCYTSDTALGERVRAAAAGADLVLAEATLSHEYAGRVPHMTSTEAARLAVEAGADRLVLTHLWPGSEYDEELGRAREVFGPKAYLARELDTYDIRPTTGRYEGRCDDGSQ